MLVSFASVYLVLSANAASVGGTPDFVARYFVAFAAAYAAFAATAVTSVANGRPWLARGCACGLALVLSWQMLDLAYPVAGRVSTASMRDPFTVADVDAELPLARLGEERMWRCRSRPT